MSPTIHQLAAGARKKKHKKLRASAFKGAPNRRGVFIKLLRCHHENPIQQKELMLKCG